MHIVHPYNTSMKISEITNHWQIDFEEFLSTFNPYSKPPGVCWNKPIQLLGIICVQRVKHLPFGTLLLRVALESSFSQLPNASNQLMDLKRRETGSFHTHFISITRSANNRSGNAIKALRFHVDWILIR